MPLPRFYSFIQLCLLISVCILSVANASSSDIDILRLTMDPLDAQVLFKKDPSDKSSFDVQLNDSNAQTTLQGRIKVLGSFSRRFPKKNLLIKLQKGQTWHRQRRIALDAMATDPSMMREWLSWKFIQAMGMPAPTARYLKLYINNKYHGLFLHTEWLDPDLLAQHGLGSEGEFFHPIDSRFCGDLKDVQLAEIKRCWFKLSPENNNYNSLVQLATDVNNVTIDQFDDWLDTHFDSETVINWLLVNILTSNGDTYNKNYFLYDSTTTRKWNLIPWDYDLTFGRNWDAYLPYPHSILNDNFQYFYPPELGAVNALKEKALRNPEIRQRIMTRLKHVLGLQRDGNAPNYAWFSPTEIKNRMSALMPLLIAARQDDPFQQDKGIRFDEEVESLWHYVQRRSAYIREITDGDFPWNADNVFWNPANAPPQLPLKVQLANTYSIGPSPDFTIITAPAYGYALAGLRLADSKGAAEFRIEADIQESPDYIPSGYDASQCIQRNWLLTLRTPFTERVIDLQLDYLQENSQRNELGAITEERELSVWVLDGKEWSEVNARINPLSNVLTINSIEMKPGQMYRFAACTQ